MQLCVLLVNSPDVYEICMNSDVYEGISRTNDA